MAGSCVRCIFSPLKICRSIFSSGWIMLHSHQMGVRIPVAPHPYQHLVQLVFLILAVLDMVEKAKSASEARRPNSAYSLFLQVKLYWNMVTYVGLFTSYVCFCFTVAELNSCHRDHLAYKA